MAKVISLDYPHAEFNFVSLKDDCQGYMAAYQAHELGTISALIPWKDLIGVFRKHGYRPKKRGPTSAFTLRGKIALMFLKSYLNGISDRELIDRLNRDSFLQLFWGVYIGYKEPITNFKVVSAIRCELSRYLNIDELQLELVKSYKPHLQHPHIAHLDATVYESSIRYPTDVKILWEGCEWIHKQIKRHCRTFGIRRVRTKYKEIREAFYRYQKKRKKTHAKRWH